MGTARYTHHRCKILCQWPLHLLLLVGFSSTALASASEARLYDDVLSQYNHDVRPVKNVSDTIKVNVDLSIIDVRDLDLERGVLDMVSFISLAWPDYQLRWDPSEYGGISALHLPAETIWVPDIVIYNLVSPPVDLSPSRVVIRSDGHVLLIKSQRTRTLCTSERGLAQHVCRLKFASWTYNGFKVDVESEGKKVNMNDYTGNNRWKIIEGNVTRNVILYPCCPEFYPDVTAEIVLVPFDEKSRDNAATSNALQPVSPHKLCHTCCVVFLSIIMLIF